MTREVHTMTVTDERTQTAARATATEVGGATPMRKGWRRPSRRVAAAAIAFGILIGTAAGYVLHETSADPLERGRAADATRLQAQADAYLGRQAAVERGRAADATRLQAQADAYLGRQAAVERGRAADAARLQAQADAYLAGQQETGGGGAASAGSDVHLTNLSQELGAG